MKYFIKPLTWLDLTWVKLSWVCKRNAKQFIYQITVIKNNKAFEKRIKCLIIKSINEEDGLN